MPDSQLIYNEVHLNNYEYDEKNKYIIALLLLSNLFTGCEIGFLDNEAFSDLTREGYYENYLIMRLL